MRRTEQRQGLRMLKLRDVLGRWEADELSQLEAAELLGMSERTFRRWTRRYEEEGEAAMIPGHRHELVENAAFLRRAERY